jgi:hypothetical protein
MIVNSIGVYLSQTVHDHARHQDQGGCPRRHGGDAPVIQKYTGVLGAVDVFTGPTAFSILESIRLDLGYRMDFHP